MVWRAATQRAVAADVSGEVEGDGKDAERWWQQLVDLSGVDLLGASTICQRVPDGYDFEKKIGQEIAAFAANDEIDWYWYEELQTLNRVIWRAAITRMNLTSI